MSRLGRPRIVVNADDFGMNQGANEAIAACFGQGLLSSTTAMAGMECLPAAVDLARRGGWVASVGVHVNLSEGPPRTDGVRQFRQVCGEDGEFVLGPRRPGYMPGALRRAVGVEVCAQVRACRAVGLKPYHADSHHHIHTVPILFAPVARALRDEGITAMRLGRNLAAKSRGGLRGWYKAGLNWRIRRVGFATTDFFGDLEEFLAARDAGEVRQGTYEIMVHPTVAGGGEIIDAVDGMPLIGRLEQALWDCELVSYPSHAR